MRIVALQSPAVRLCRASPTYEAWRTSLVAALGASSTLIEATTLYTRELQTITWCKGGRLAELIGAYKSTMTWPR